MQQYFCGDVVLPDRIVTDGCVHVRDGRIVAVDHASRLLEGEKPAAPRAGSDDAYIEVDGFIVPGFVDLHVHGGAGSDFMDGTKEAFDKAVACHARHGTTSIVPTTTVARHDQIMTVLQLTEEYRRGGVQDVAPSGNGASAEGVAGRVAGARVLGAHFYGPYFRYEARGAHPGAAIRAPEKSEYSQYLEFADSICTATVAPELPGAAGFAIACAEAGVRTNVGHSWATFKQMEEAVGWGVRHIDHLFCAMSDKTRLRQFQTYPMQGGVLEATLYFDELTTEVIADGKHLSADLLLLALKFKGIDRLALVTDCNRALDMPEGPYMIGPLDGGEPLIHKDGVGLMPDGTGLASSVKGMDHMVRTFAELTGRPLWEVVRMASLTPARIVGWDREIGSLEAGKRADIVLMNRAMEVERVFIEGKELAD